jgi:hypothetical protein
LGELMRGIASKRLPATTAVIAILALAGCASSSKAPTGRIDADTTTASVATSTTVITKHKPKPTMASVAPTVPPVTFQQTFRQLSPPPTYSHYPAPTYSTSMPIPEHAG